MFCTPRSLSIRSTLAVAAIFMARVGPEARAQVIDYAVIGASKRLSFTQGRDLDFEF